MIKTANFQKASDLAYDILMEHSTGTLPIDIFKIIRHNFPEIILMTFTEWKKKSKHECEMLEVFGSDQGVVFYNGVKYCIIYNDKKCFQTQRWTVAHELGHILLDHVKDDDYLKFSSKDSPYENEANTFAKHLLVPFPVAKYLFTVFDRHVIYPHDIENVFDVGPEASEHIIDHFNKLYYFPTNPVLEGKFSGTLTRLCKNNNCS